MPSSRAYHEAREWSAPYRLPVGYAGGRVDIAEGALYYVDSFDRILMGWHGTYDPPRDMGGESLV